MNFDVLTEKIRSGNLTINDYRADTDEFAAVMHLSFKLRRFDELSDDSLIGEGAFSKVHDTERIVVDMFGTVLADDLETLYHIYTVINEVVGAIHNRAKSHKQLIGKLIPVSKRFRLPPKMYNRGKGRQAAELNLATLLNILKSNEKGMYNENKDDIRELYRLLETEKSSKSYIPMDYVLRVETPCRDPNNLLEFLTCRETNYRPTPRGVEYVAKVDDEVLALPAYVAAGTIGSFLNELQDETEGFLFVEGTFVRDGAPEGGEEPMTTEQANPAFKTDLTKRANLRNGTVVPLGMRKSYTIMEKAIPLESFLETPGDVYSAVFNAIHALYVAGLYFRFTHNDLHLGNLLAVPHDGSPRTYRYLDTSDTEVLLSVEGQTFITKIGDYGTARLAVRQEDNERDVIVVSQHRDLKQFNKADFNPAYDILMLIGPGMFIRGGEISPDALDGVLEPAHYKELFSIITGQTLKSNTFSDILTELEASYVKYRPKNEFTTSIQPVKYEVLFKRLLDKIDTFPGFSVSKAKLPADIKPLPRLQMPDVPVFYKDAGIVPGTLKTLLSILSTPSYQGTRGRGGRGSLPSRQNDDAQNWGVPWFKLYQTTVSELRSHIPIDKRSEGVVHFAVIDLSLMSQAKGVESYRFSTECCGSNPVDFLRTNAGFAINGAFFDARAEYVPLGLYSESKSPRNSLNKRKFTLKGGKEYARDFAFVSISPDGHSIDIREKIGKQDTDYFQSAPVLAFPDKSGKQLTGKYSETKRVQSVGNVYKYRCDNIPDDGSKVIRTSGNQKYVRDYGDYYFQNCGAIVPGNLSHLGNPNPRSMIALINKGRSRYAVFVVADSERSVTVRKAVGETGLTVSDMVNLSKLLGAQKSINLDGGRSSNMCWSFERPNTQSSRTVYCTSSEEFYPVGNILAVSNTR